ncbi:MAG: serine hydrolase [Bacteroidia bacterium]|nr:serine hydrolase [Bacteroidia bacterium]
MKNPKILFLTFLILLGWIPLLLTGSKPQPENETELLTAAIDKAIKDEMARQEIIGVAVGVVKGGKIIYTKGHGHLDLNRTKAVTKSTRFRWASISKTLNAVAAFQLIEDNKISLNTRVHTKVSNWPSSGNKGLVTLGHTLSNTAGVNHYDNYSRNKYPSSKNSKYDSKATVEVFKSAPLNFKPGSDYEYSTFGHNLAGAALDKVAPGGYVSWVNNKIAKKASMTSLSSTAGSPRGFAKDCKGKLVAKNEGSTTWKLPGGGWSSNIVDLTRFMEALMNGKLLKNTSAMWANPPKAEENYKYGIYQNGSGSNHRVWHSGAHDDLRSIMHFYTQRKIGVCIFINGASYVDVNRLAWHVYKAAGLSVTTVNLPTYECPDKYNKSRKKSEPSNPCGGYYTGAWRKSGTQSIVRRGYSTNEFYDTWKQLYDQGYKCVDFDTYKDGSTRRWDGVFEKSSTAAAMWRGFDQNGFKKKWDEMNKKGYRLIDLETYKDGSSRKWAGLFMKGSGKYAMWRNFSTDDFGKKRKEMSKQGMKLIDVETYVDGGKRKWAGVWRQGSGELLNRNYKTEDFKALRRKRRDAGYKLVDVETYMDGSTRKWAGIWERSSQGEGFYYGYRYCDLLYKYRYDAPNGYKVMDLERY